jgi:allophanate hydrolase subunit 1
MQLRISAATSQHPNVRLALGVTSLIARISSQSYADSVDVVATSNSVELSVAYTANRAAMENRLEQLKSVAQQTGLSVQSCCIAGFTLTIEVS